MRSFFCKNHLGKENTLGDEGCRRPRTCSHIRKRDLLNYTASEFSLNENLGGEGKLVVGEKISRPKGRGTIRLKPNG